MNILLSRKLILSLLFIIMATFFLCYQPPYLLDTQWLEVFGSIVLMYASGQAILEVRKDKFIKKFNMPIMIKSFKEKASQLFSSGFIISIFLSLFVSLLFYLGKIQFEAWWASYSIIVLGYNVGNASTKDFNPPKAD